MLRLEETEDMSKLNAILDCILEQKREVGGMTMNSK